MKKLAFMFLFFALMAPCLAHADAVIDIRNASGVTLACLVYHIDHDQRAVYPDPINVMGAELREGENFKGDFERYVGSYAILVSAGERRNALLFSINADMKVVTLTILEDLEILLTSSMGL